MKISILILILGMGIVTFLPRFFPMAFLARWVIPERVKMGLGYIPIAILSAIFFPMREETLKSNLNTFSLLSLFLPLPGR